jgi:hypothetical protein
LTRQLGRVQRQIRRAYLADPASTLHTVELAAWCYPHVREVRRKHRWAIVVSAKRVAVRLGRDKRGVIFGAKED